MKRSEEFAAILNGQLDDNFLATRGICEVHQRELLEKHPELFWEIAPKLKRIASSILMDIVQDYPEHIEVIFTRCLPEDVQLAFVENYPEYVAEYLETLQGALSDNRGAYLCKDAEDLYFEFREEDPSLPMIPTLPRAGKSTYSPFAAFFAGR